MWRGGSSGWAGVWCTGGGRIGGEEDLGLAGGWEDVLGHRGDGGGGMERRKNQNIKREEEEVAGGAPAKGKWSPRARIISFLENCRRNCFMHRIIP